MVYFNPFKALYLCMFAFMGRKKERKAITYLTEDQKIQLMRDYDESGMAAAQVCEKYGISQSALYKIKKAYWSIYVTTKESMNNRDKITTLNAVKIDTTRKIAAVEMLAGNVLTKILSLIDHKLDLEQMRLQGRKIVNDDGQEIDISDKVSVQELTRFFQAAAPYFLKVQEGSPVTETTLAKKHSFITQILNQQIINNNGNNPNTASGDAAK